MENKIILTTKGNISGADKQALRRAGVVIAEVKDINAIKIIAGTDYFDLDDIAISAIETIHAYSSDNPRSELAKKLLGRVIKKSQQPKSPNQ